MPQARRKKKTNGLAPTGAVEKLNGHMYVHRCLVLEQEMAAHFQQLQVARQEVHASNLREQVGYDWRALQQQGQVTALLTQSDMCADTVHDQPAHILPGGCKLSTVDTGVARQGGT